MEQYNLEGTETARSLMKAFAGESQARNRYTFYEKEARKEGYAVLADIFHETAANEEAHAKRFFDLMNQYGLNQRTVDIGADFPVSLNDTMTNLISASQGEHEEWDQLYPKFAEVALAEGFPQVATVFKLIASIEKFHEERFKKCVQLLRDGELFKKPLGVQWICSVCGYIHEGVSAPEICPVCQHPQSYYRVLKDSL